MAIATNKAVISFAGGSLARRLGLSVQDATTSFSVDASHAVAGGGLLNPDQEGKRYSKTISLDSLKDVDHVVLWVGTNDLFAHQKEGKHVTDITLFKNKGNRNQFSKKLSEFLISYNGKTVWIVGLIPRYLNISCCDKHKVGEDTKTEVLNLVKVVNIDISRKANYFSKNGKNVSFVNPEELANTSSLDWTTALDRDSIHLTREMNETFADNMRKIISAHLDKQQCLTEGKKIPSPLSVE